MYSISHHHRYSHTLYISLWQKKVRSTFRPEASAFFGASTTTVSPSEVPVPTDQPSPTSPAGAGEPWEPGWRAVGPGIEDVSNQDVFFAGWWFGT